MRPSLRRRAAQRHHGASWVQRRDESMFGKVLGMVMREHRGTHTLNLMTTGDVPRVYRAPAPQSQIEITRDQTTIISNDSI